MQPDASSKASGSGDQLIGRKGRSVEGLRREIKCDLITFVHTSTIIQVESWFILSDLMKPNPQDEEVSPQMVTFHKSTLVMYYFYFCCW